MLPGVRGGHATLAALAVTIAMATACGLDTGGLGETAGDDGGTGNDGSTAGDATNDAVAEGVVDGQRIDARDGPSTDTTAADGTALEGGCDANAENCTNGVDDNCNGLIDCQDPACGTPSCRCVDPAPLTWSGPRELWEGTGSAPTCTGGFGSPVIDGHGSLVDPGCSACQCGAPAGAQCGLQVYANDSNGCGGSPCGGGILTNGKCTSTQGCPTGSGNYHLNIGSPAANGGSCSASGGTLQTPWWGSEARSCAPAYALERGSCGAGKVSISVPASPFEAKACIAWNGAVLCPSGAYSVQKVYSAGYAGSRSCLACACGAPGGVACSPGTVGVYSDAACSASQLQGSESTGQSCTGRYTFSSLELTGSTPSGGSCTASGGQEVGALIPTGATTFCCMP